MSPPRPPRRPWWAAFPGSLSQSEPVLLKARDVGQTLGDRWRQHRLAILAVLAVSAIVLGFVGSYRATKDVWQAAYDTLALLTLNYEGKSGETAIQIARLLGPAVTAYATFAAITAVLHEQWHQARARRRSGHVLVCGLGNRSVQLIRSLRQRRVRVPVVAVEIDGTNPNIPAARRLGALVVVGDATDEDVLRSAGGRKATTLISLCDEDATNAGVASAMRRLQRSAGNPLAAYCHGTRRALVDELTSLSIAGSSPLFTLEWFNITERAARLLLAEYAWKEESTANRKPIHLVVVGTDELAEALVANAGRAWNALNHGDPQLLRVTIADIGATAWIEKVSGRYPSLPKAVRLTSYEEDFRASVNAETARVALGDANAVFVLADDDGSGLEAGFALARLVERPGAIVVRLSGRGEQLLEALASGGTAQPPIRLFDILERICSVEMITDGVVETLARTLHGVYIAQAARTEDDDSSRPTVPYEQLHPEFKTSSRAQARHVATKLEQLGCILQPLTDWNATIIELSASEVEALAEVEHTRWNSERLAGGYKPGPETDRAQKINKWVNVPWDKLPESIKEFDRAFVRALPEALASAGYGMRRVK